MTYKEAKEIVIGYITSKRKYPVDDYPVIIDEKTVEYSFGWLFYYNGKRYVESGDDFHSYIGNSPIFIDKNDKSVNLLWKPGIAIEKQIEKYMLEKKYK